MTHRHLLSKLLNYSAKTLAMLAFMASAAVQVGCHVSGASSEVTQTQSAATLSESSNRSIDVEPILGTHTAALRALETVFHENKGIKPVYTNCLDHQSSLNQVWFKAISQRTDASWLLLAFRMAEADDQNLLKAIEIIDKIRAHGRTYDIDDILDFHQGRFWMQFAQSHQDDEATDAYQKAYEAFERVTKVRKSPYYHLAKAERLKASLALERDVSKELSEFIKNYPDYPGLLDFKLALATLQFKNGKNELAVPAVQDLAYLYPWSPIAQKAAQWLEERNLAPRNRSFDEEFGRVENLRKARFWDDAEQAAVEAMPKYPESYQLMVQHARIAYERSYHEESAKRFEDILQKLDGQTKDKLRPAGVIAYIYRAYAYAGNCEKALEYHALNAAKLGKKDRARSTMEFALSCGALDVAWENAKTVYSETTDAKELYQFGLIAYLNGQYEVARQKFALALEDLSGTNKRRVQYFIAQATLKSALTPDKTSESGDANSTETEKSVAKNAKKSKSKKSSKKKNAKKIMLAPASVERAISQFEAIISADSTDYYAILAHSRLAELERDDTNNVVQTPAIQTFGSITQNPEPPRPWSMEYVFDEKEALAGLSAKIADLKSIMPELERVEFLHNAELYSERNALFRVLAIEAMGISKMSKRPTPTNLWTTKLSLDGHLVDNRKNDTGVWGCELKDYYFDLPPKKDVTSRKKIAQHQEAIWERASDIREFFLEMLPAFHDYYLSRKYTPAQKLICGNEKNLKACSILYPHAYSEAVIQAAQSNQITPDVIWALMNIESAFNPDSISHADAYGLLQIIPMTGYKIANAMHNDEFGPYDLIEPANSILMGTWYFAQILRKFHGNTSLSMVAYNGGPHQVARWLTAYSQKMEQDAFVELIPYDEARNYVKKGMARLLVFHRIDEHNPKAFFEIPNALPQSFEEMPNY